MVNVSKICNPPTPPGVIRPENKVRILIARQYVKPETLTHFAVYVAIRNCGDAYHFGVYVAIRNCGDAYHFAGRCHTTTRNTLIIKYHLFLAWICGLFLAENPHGIL